MVIVFLVLCFVVAGSVIWYNWKLMKEDMDLIKRLDGMTEEDRLKELKKMGPF